MLSFLKSLRLPERPVAAFAGAGGKTTAIFTLARQLKPPVIVTATAHLGNWELNLADKTFILWKSDSAQIHDIQLPEGVTIIIGPVDENNRQNGLDKNQIAELVTRSDWQYFSILIEADGSRKRSLKAPAEHEPVIPEFVNTVVVVAGMSALWKSLSNERVHRVEYFSRLAGIQSGDLITPEVIIKVLKNPSGGMKNIPESAKKIVLLNQADTVNQQEAAHHIAQSLLSEYERVIVSSLNPAGNPERDIVQLNSPGKIDRTFDSHQRIKRRRVISVHERIAGIVLAAGESRRFGSPKQLVEWNGEPLLRHIVKTALDSDLYKVLVITGAYSEDIFPAIEDLPVVHIHNTEWQEGQSSTIRLGLENLSEDINGVIFFLADQPYLSRDVIRALIDTYSITLAPIVAPVVLDQRGNPVLFDRVTFPALNTLFGNQGGRYIFDRFSLQFVEWDDPKILVDIDNQKDLRFLDK